jgi:hypothetical protein
VNLGAGQCTGLSRSSGWYENPAMRNPDHEQFLQGLSEYFADASTCRDSFRPLVHLAIRLAAAGHALAVAEIVEHSPEARLFTPLCDGLQQYRGRPVDEVSHNLDFDHEVANKIIEAVSVRCMTRAVA